MNRLSAQCHATPISAHRRFGGYESRLDVGRFTRATRLRRQLSRTRTGREAGGEVLGQDIRGLPCFQGFLRFIEITL